MKKSTTKMSLVASIAALVLCCAMLIGTTFAWFTDTASTAVNSIQAGKLDIALEMNVNDGWENAEGKMLSWVKAAGGENEAVLWEPGCTYRLPELRIVNNGNLALKYKIRISGIVGDAELLEVISFTYGGGINIDAEVSLEPQQATEGFIIEGHMSESAGNEYQGLSIEGIAITVVATQDTVEHDSDDNQYDAGAKYPVLSDTEFAEAIANATAGDTISLSSGTFTMPSDINEGVTVSGSGAGNTVIAVDASGYTIENDDVTLKDLKIDGSATSSVEHGKAIYLKGNNAKIENCVISGGGTTTWGASVCVILQEGETAYITNTVISGGFRGIFLGSQAGSVVIDSCDIDAVYPINVDGDGDFSLPVINSKLHGWTSYAQITSATFIDTEFSMGASGYDVVAAYTDTTFKNCTFDSAFKIYAQRQGFGFVFENCMKDGVAVTAENFKTLFPEDPDVWTRCTCTVNGVTVTP